MATTRIRARPDRAKLVRPVSGPPRLDDEWRRWIAENLLAGADAATIATQLHERGCPPLVAEAEIRAALASPYLQGADLLRRRLAKRDWLLRGIGRLATMDGPLAVPVVRGIDPDEFFRAAYAAHRPMILQGLIDGWPAARWTFGHLAALVGDAEIEVQTRREANPLYEIESHSHRSLLPFSKVIERLMGERPSNDFYVTANNAEANRAVLAPIWRETGEMPGILAPGGDGFFWMGPRGTLTPFHHDLTNNLLLQVIGRKRVTLVPSWETPRMSNHRHCFSAYADPAAIAALPAADRPASLSCTIDAGEALFIPVGWWHHVEALDATVSLSFTGFARDNDFYSDYDCYGAM